MKKIIIKLTALDVGFLFAFPFVLMTYALIPVMGKARAIKAVGPLLTRTGVRLGGLFIPKAASPVEFSEFRNRLKRNISAVGALWQMKIEREDADGVGFQFHYCPVSTVLRRAGLRGLSKYACAADWRLAEINRGVYSFSRGQTIGTGGAFCNPIYSKISGTRARPLE